MSDLWHIRRERAATYSLYVAVASMPFSISVCHLALLVFIFLCLFEKNLRENIRNIGNNHQLVALIAFAVILLAGVSYSENKQEAWFAIEKKAFFFLIPLAFAISRIGSAKLSKNLFTVFCWSCFAALSLCYITAFQRLQLFHEGKLGTDTINYLSSSEFWTTRDGKQNAWLFFSYVGLSSGVKMHPTYLSMYSAFCCLILVYRYLYSDSTRLKMIVDFFLIVFFSCSIIFLSARIILLLLGILYGGLFVYQMIRVKQRMTTTFALFVLIIAMIAGVLLNPVTRYRQVDEIAMNGFSVSTNKNYNNSTGIRASLWWLSAQTYLNSNFFFGVGTGDVEDAVRSTGTQFGITNVLDSYSPHNEYLHLLLATGLPGLAFFLIYIGAGVVKAWQNRDIIFLNFMLLFMAVCMTESALELQKGIVFFSIFFCCMSFQKENASEMIAPLNIASVADQER